MLNIFSHFTRKAKAQRALHVWKAAHGRYLDATPDKAPKSAPSVRVSARAA